MSLCFFPNPNKNYVRSEADSIRTVTLAFTGDLMCHSPQMDYARIAKDGFDFKPVFSEVKKCLSQADVTFGNFETTLSGKENKYSGYPLFNTPDEYLDAVKDCGFDFLFTSNNHCLDRGKKGILSTLKKIRLAGLNSTGTYESQRDRDSIRIIHVNGMNIAVLAYTYGTNGNLIPKDGKYLVNLIDTLLVKHDIQSAHNKSVDAVLVYYHFGEEYQRAPNSYQKEIVRKTLGYGANLIIASHPHVIQRVEYFPSADEKFPRAFVAYSLGNFISNQRWRYSDCGLILTLTLKQNILTKNITVSNVATFPTWVYKGQVDCINRFVVLPSDTNIYKLPKWLSVQDKNKLLQSFSDTKQLFISLE
jgi:poly-gamma-glutamate capsule biosynthesis protein CapA/YwtB (metallophosphatase superfamily)